MIDERTLHLAKQNKFVRTTAKCKCGQCAHLVYAGGCQARTVISDDEALNRQLLCPECTFPGCES
jgi:hypothetical protein